MQVYKIVESRSKWKSKAIERRLNLKKNNRKILSLEKKVNKLKQQHETLYFEHQKTQQENLDLKNQIQEKRVQNIQVVSIFIYLHAWVSFRSVVKILRFYRTICHHRFRIPHYTTVIHYCLRAGMGLLDQVQTCKEKWLAIIDMSISIGTQKLLVVLRVKTDALKFSKGGICLNHCECIGLKISDTWNKETICEALYEIFARAGTPIGIVKDGGSDITAGIREWIKKYAKSLVFMISDITHVLNNALKNYYQLQLSFDRIKSWRQEFSSKVRQISLAFLLPPCMKVNCRFVNFIYTIKWFEKLFEYKQRGFPGLLEGERQKLIRMFVPLQKLKVFIENMSKAYRICFHLMETLKIQGLNPQTYAAGLEMLKALNIHSPIRKKIHKWLDEHFEIQQTLCKDLSSLIVSSDVIESLFGKFKQTLQRFPHAELNRLIYLLPLFCGRHEFSDISEALKEVSHKRYKKEIENLPKTIHMKRTEYFSNRNKKSIKSRGDPKMVPPFSRKG